MQIIKGLYFFFLLLPISLWGQSATIEWGALLSDSNFNPVDILANTTEYVYVLAEKEEKVAIQKFDPNSLKLISEEEIRLPIAKGKSSLEEIKVVGNKVLVFYTHYHKRTFNLYLKILDENSSLDKVTKPILSLENISKGSVKHLKFHQSFNNKYLGVSIISNKGKEKLLVAKVFNQTLAEVNSLELELSNENRMEHRLQNLCVGDNADLNIFYSRLVNGFPMVNKLLIKTKMEKQAYSIPLELEFDMSAFSYSTYLNVNSDGDLCLMGFYQGEFHFFDWSRYKAKEGGGFFFFKVDHLSHKLDVENIEIILDDIQEDLYASEKESKPPYQYPEDAYISSIYKEQNGGFFLVLEERFAARSTVSSLGNHYLFKISTKGAVESAQIIAKKQLRIKVERSAFFDLPLASGAVAHHYSSFHAFNGEEFYFVFLDHPENIGNVASETKKLKAIKKPEQGVPILVHLTPNGNISQRKSIGINGSKEIIIKPLLSSVAKDKIFVFGCVDGVASLGILTIKK